MRIDIFDDSYPNHYNKEPRCWVDVECHAAPTTRDDRCRVVGGVAPCKMPPGLHHRVPCRKMSTFISSGRTGPMYVPKKWRSIWKVARRSMQWKHGTTAWSRKNAERWANEKMQVARQSKKRRGRKPILQGNLEYIYSIHLDIGPSVARKITIDKKTKDKSHTITSLRCPRFLEFLSHGIVRSPLIYFRSLTSMHSETSFLCRFVRVPDSEVLDLKSISMNAGAVFSFPGTRTCLAHPLT